MKCTEKTEVWSRVCGFFRPVAQWNRGKKQEYRDRTPYKVEADHGDRTAD
jgi:ribonucleoside-triphosphate reductase